MFRISFFGGFRKKDVIKYLEALGEEKNALQRQIDIIASEDGSLGEALEKSQVIEHDDEAAQVCELQAQIAALHGELDAKNIEKAGIIATMQAEIDSLNEKNRLIALEKAQAQACEKHCPELVLAIKCQSDSSATDARRAEEALAEFRRSIDEITREFSALVDVAAESGATAREKTTVKLTSIREILDRVKYISGK